MWGRLLLATPVVAWAVYEWLYYRIPVNDKPYGCRDGCSCKR